MCVEKAGNAGFACVRDFLRAGEHERVVTLAAPDRRDADDYACPATPETVRLVRHVASTGKVRVLMTNLFDATRFPASVFGDLYHHRWRIEPVGGQAHLVSAAHHLHLVRFAVGQEGSQNAHQTVDGNPKVHQLSAHC